MDVDKEHHLSHLLCTPFLDPLCRSLSLFYCGSFNEKTDLHKHWHIKKTTKLKIIILKYNNHRKFFFFFFKCTFFKDGSWNDKWNLLQGFHILVAGTDNLYLRQTEDKHSGHIGLSMVPTSYCSRNVTRYNCTWRRKAIIWDEHTTRLYFKLGERKQNKSKIKILGID